MGVSPPPGTKGRIIVFGIAFWYPLAGVTYQFLHYLIALRRLGYDPYYVEDSARLIYDPRTHEMSPDASGNVAAVAPVLDAHGFAGRWAFRSNYSGGSCYGMDEKEILELYRTADAFLNVTGSQEIRPEHLVCPRRIYVETDPFATQVGVALGHAATIAALSAHNTHFSFGENLGASDCAVPVERFQWLPTRQPVVLDLWANPYTTDRGAYTTIATWRNRDKDITFAGETYYWTKDREFMAVIDLPRRSSASFELALGVDAETRDMLRAYGWRQANSVDISRGLDRYRTYIQRSRGEFTVARDQYVRGRTGWFSDRSACYLAAGRPVIAQETGFSKFLPTGKGLYAFCSLDEIVAAVEAIESDHAGNCRAARDIAAEYFAAERVVRQLMDRAGV